MEVVGDTRREPRATARARQEPRTTAGPASGTSRAGRSFGCRRGGMKPILHALVLFFVVHSIDSAELRKPRVQGRSMVISRTGIAATEQVLASQAAAEILAE